MPKNNDEMRDYSIWFTHNGEKQKFFGSEETLLRDFPGCEIIRKRKLRLGWRSGDQ